VTLPVSSSFVNDDPNSAPVVPALPVNGTLRVTAVTREGS
jgi:hypothetical protein